MRVSLVKVVSEWLLGNRERSGELQYKERTLMLVDGKRSFGMAVNASPSRSVLSRNQYSEDRSQPKEDGNKDKK